MALLVKPTKYIKNTTAGDLDHVNTGTTFVAGQYQEVDESIIYRFMDSQLEGWFDAGSVIYAEDNDGSADYTNKYVGWMLLFNFGLGQLFLSPSNSDRSNNYIAENVQEALEEVDDIARLPVSPLPLIMNGTMSNGDWITYSNLTPNTAIVIPVKSQLVAFTWANTSTSREFDLEFYKNGRGTTKYATREVRSGLTTSGYFSGLTDPFNAGDTLDIKYIDQGSNASDLVLVLYLKAVI